MKRYLTPKLMMFVLALTLALLAVTPGRLAKVRAAVAEQILPAKLSALARTTARRTTLALNQACVTNPVAPQTTVDFIPIA